MEKQERIRQEQLQEAVYPHILTIARALSGHFSKEEIIKTMREAIDELEKED